MSNIGLVLRQLRAMNELAPGSHPPNHSPFLVAGVVHDVGVNREHLARKVDHRQPDGEVSHYDDVSMS